MHCQFLGAMAIFYNFPQKYPGFDWIKYLYLTAPATK
jgi:hypothetical protein